jgi:hypothetical protein
MLSILYPVVKMINKFNTIAFSGVTMAWRRRDQLPYFCDLQRG